jgi:hypothetical protein|tara:strand:+ start:1007 stop:1162 length:156 start_codon:yes stop_codon:yes gene_type:complete
MEETVKFLLDLSKSVDREEQIQNLHPIDRENLESIVYLAITLNDKLNQKLV